MAKYGQDVSSTSAETPQPYGSAHDLPSFVEMRQQLRVLKGLTLLVMRDKHKEMQELERQLVAMADCVDAFYELLGPRHWTFNDWMNLTKIDEVLDMSADAGEAEKKLIELYRDRQASLELTRSR